MKRFVSNVSTISFLAFLFCSLTASLSAARSGCQERDPGTSFFSLEDLYDKLGFRDLNTSTKPRSRVKVAIFDQGFVGFDPDKQPGCTLPENTRLMPQARPSRDTDSHGLYAAQLFYQLLTNDLRNKNASEPELLLFSVFNTYAYSNLVHAVDTAIKEGVKVVIIPQILSFGGNFDGTGPFNVQISRLTKAKILVLVSAGNTGQAVFNGPVLPSIRARHRGFVPLYYSAQVLVGRCLPPQGQDTCNIRVTASWNSVDKVSTRGTNKDLDLFVFQPRADSHDFVAQNNAEMKRFQTEIETMFEAYQTRAPASQGNLEDGVLYASAFKQVIKIPEGEEARGRAERAFEMVSGPVRKGPIFIRLKISSNNFTDADKVRVTLTGSSIVWLGGADQKESLPVMADNPDVVTVGALDEDRNHWSGSGVSEKYAKPEIYAPGEAQAELDNELRGTSLAVMYAGAAATAMISIDASYAQKAKFIRASRIMDPHFSENGPQRVRENYQYTAQRPRQQIPLTATYLRIPTAEAIRLFEIRSRGGYSPVVGM